MVGIQACLPPHNFNVVLLVRGLTDHWIFSNRHYMSEIDNQKTLLILITGIMAAGKSTVAQQLCERFPKSVHLRGDVFRRMIVNGQAEMGMNLSSEARLQLSLRYKIAAAVATMYLDMGFSVVYQDIILGDDLHQVAQLLTQHRLHVVVLCPDADTVAARESARHKTGYGNLSIIAFDEMLKLNTPKLGLWLDTSHQTATETVEAILAQLQQSRIAQV